jgi:hypothetical protein
MLSVEDNNMKTKDYQALAKLAGCTVGEVILWRAYHKLFFPNKIQAIGVREIIFKAAERCRTSL